MLKSLVKSGQVVSKMHSVHYRRAERLPVNVIDFVSEVKAKLLKFACLNFPILIQEELRL